MADKEPVTAEYSGAATGGSATETTGAVLKQYMPKEVIMAILRSETHRISKDKIRRSLRSFVTGAGRTRGVKSIAPHECRSLPSRKKILEFSARG